MKKKILSYILYFTLIILVIFNIGLLFSKKVYYEFQYPEETPDDYNFIAKIDYTDLILDTYKNEFTKGITWEKDTVIHYKLSNVEKNRIYNLMKSIDIVKYPNFFAPKTNKLIHPSPTYYFKCEFDNVKVEIRWVYNTESETEDAVKFRNFMYSIFENILEEKEIKKLPETYRPRM